MKTAKLTPGLGVGNGDLGRRALTAWFRSGGIDQPTPPQTHTLEGKSYVVLTNVNGVLAVYRVKTDGVLKRLKRYPREFEDI